MDLELTTALCDSSMLKKSVIIRDLLKQKTLRDLPRENKKTTKNILKHLKVNTLEVNQMAYQEYSLNFIFIWEKRDTFQVLPKEKDFFLPQLRGQYRIGNDSSRTLNALLHPTLTLPVLNTSSAGMPDF